MQKSRCTDDDFRELILVYYCSFILYSVVEIEREFHLQLEENAKIIFWPYINNFDFCRVWGCEIYRNSRQCQFRMEVYFVAVNELEDNKTSCSSWSNGNIDFQCKQNSACKMFSLTIIFN